MQDTHSETTIGKCPLLSCRARRLELPGPIASAWRHAPAARALAATGLLILAGAAPQVSAQVFKCTFPDGTVSYSDQRCRGASSVTEVSMPPPAPPSPAPRGRDPLARDDGDRRDEASADTRDQPLPLVCERALEQLDRTRRGGLGDPVEARAALERVLEMCWIILEPARDPRRRAGVLDPTGRVEGAVGGRPDGAAAARGEGAFAGPGGGRPPGPAGSSGGAGEPPRR